MGSDSSVSKPPPYVTYSTFQNFLRAQKEKVLPTRVDKSMLGNLSGGAQSALLATLRWLNLVDSSDVPNVMLGQLTEAVDTEAYGRILRTVLEDSPYQLLGNPDFDITRATAQQLENHLKQFGGKGSTVLKSMAFFIAAAKDAGVSLSPHIKVPSQGSSTRKQGRKVATEKRSAVDSAEITAQVSQGPQPPSASSGLNSGYVRISIPIHGMLEGVVYLPDGLSRRQWAHALKMTTFILENYRMDELLGDAE